MVRERRKTEKVEEKQEVVDQEEKVKPRQRSVSRRNMQSLVIGLVGAVLTLGAYSQTYVDPGKSLGAGLFVLFFGLLVSEGFISL
ncbi:unnamed protein product [Arabidopsis lyrata]|uniref:Uncharacterized protein n=1 Tax=Arabidopsis lyrata subsp. lyrata TaxID=81972 RepID=D7LM76_ARALL|nr:uncharacterized protein LOC9313220 [Arabidopsis lyrata subsp. lyrata]EFH53411.1 hypothetical protein ARALYDRAFT_484672 [Arabidopsis lyrata subsp. lyrata]CAH8267122.1 unnamed protein product [Arabidopsis lyrata]|eukprot:XP_020881268.1 uncharacterized protein LOC9313220 [Arabidopsis lyrata subsp. lyrata]